VYVEIDGSTTWGPGGYGTKSPNVTLVVEGSKISQKRVMAYLNGFYGTIMIN